MLRDGNEINLVSTPIPIQGPNGFDIDFAWSPDGTQLLYVHGSQLYKVNLDGSGLQLFAELSSEEFAEVDWSVATGKVAARAVGSAPYQSRIMLFSSNGTLEEELVPDGPGSIGGPSFSIDGNSILYTRDTSGFESPDGRQLESHIFLKNLTTGLVTDLSVNKPLGFNDLEPEFSPDGAYVVFTQTNNFPNSKKDIYIINTSGQGRTLLFENAEMPDWWP